MLRYLAIKENRVSPETFDRINELDRFSQELRHDMVKSLFEDKGLSFEQIENGIREAMKGALTQ